ncbi:MAG: oligosaccharide flippase family protein [Verrucomicrobiae bacterium]|nr:oligosaccharide flippase family protein [Verrucomicrobiae bacterium]
MNAAPPGGTFRAPGTPWWRSGWELLKSQYSGSSGRSRFARAASWNVVGGVASRGLMLVASLLVARTLGDTMFGQLGMIQNTFLMVGVFASLGLGMTATRFLALYRQTAPDRAGRVATLAPLGAGLLATAGAIGIVACAPWLARVSLNEPALGFALRLAAPMLVLGALQDANQGILAGLEAFRVLARVTAITSVAQALGMVVGAYSGGLPGSLVGMICGMAVGLVVSSLAVRAALVRAGLKTGLSGWLDEVPALWRFALPAVLAGGVVLPANWLVGALLMHQPGGGAEMGQYNAAHQVRIMILYIPGMVATAGLPVLTHLWKHARGGEYFRIIRIKLVLGFITASLVAVPAILAAPWIMTAFGEGFPEGAPVLRVLACAAVITATLNMIGQSLVSEGRMWTGLLLNVIWATVLIGLSIAWIPTHGALGLAWANFAAFAVHLVTVSLYVLRQSRDGGRDRLEPSEVTPV